MSALRVSGERDNLFSGCLSAVNVLTVQQWDVWLFAASGASVTAAAKEDKQRSRTVRKVWNDEVLNEGILQEHADCVNMLCERHSTFMVLYRSDVVYSRCNL